MLKNSLDAIQTYWQLFLRSFDRMAEASSDPHILSSILSGVPFVISLVGMLGCLACVITKGKNNRLNFELILLYLFGIVISLLAATSSQAAHDLLAEFNPNLNEIVVAELAGRHAMITWQWIALLLPMIFLLPLILFSKQKKLRFILLILILICPVGTFLYTSATALGGAALNHQELTIAIQNARSQSKERNYTLAQALGLAPLQEAVPTSQDATKLKLENIGEALKKNAESSKPPLPEEPEKSEHKAKTPQAKGRPKPSADPPGGGSGIFDF